MSRCDLAFFPADYRFCGAPWRRLAHLVTDDHHPITPVNSSISSDPTGKAATLSPRPCAPPPPRATPSRCYLRRLLMGGRHAAVYEETCHDGRSDTCRPSKGMDGMDLLSEQHKVPCSDIVSTGPLCAYSDCINYPSSVLENGTGCFSSIFSTHMTDVKSKLCRLIILKHYQKKTFRLEDLIHCLTMTRV